MSAVPSTGLADPAAHGADATSVLYERHGSRIFAFCFSRLRTREEAEDATQTTFLNAFRSLQAGVVPAYELAWLFRIADNVCRDRHKAAWRRARIEAVRDLDELHDAVPARDHGADGLTGLSDALASMPARQRRAILLREWQGLSYAEIARELGVSKAAVETLIFRARRSLARGLEEPRERRRASFDLGSLLALAKTLLQGSAAVKAAAVVTGAGLVAAVPLSDAERPGPRSRPGPSTTASQTASPSRDRVAVGPAASDRDPAARATAASRPAQTRVTPAVSARPPRDRTSGTTPSATRPDAAPRRPAGTTATVARKSPAATENRAPQPLVPPEPPRVPDAPAAAPPPPPPPPPASVLPEAPPLPEVPTVEPPALPELPDVPVDVPELPVPSLP